MGSAVHAKTNTKVFRGAKVQLVHTLTVIIRAASIRMDLL